MLFSAKSLNLLFLYTFVSFLSYLLCNYIGSVLCTLMHCDTIFLQPNFLHISKISKFRDFRFQLIYKEKRFSYSFKLVYFPISSLSLTLQYCGKN